MEWAGSILPYLLEFPISSIILEWLYLPRLRTFAFTKLIFSEAELNQTVDFDFAQTELMLNEFHSLGGKFIIDIRILLSM